MNHRAWFAIMLATCALAQDRGFIQIPESRKLALVIGNSDYPKAPLKNPVNDAAAMEATLRKAGFNVTVVRNADLRRMRTAIDDFTAKLGPGSLGFFYFAGHGVQVNSVNYLLPVDFSASSEDDVPYEAYPANRVQAKLEGSGARLRVLVLDACRNNPFRFKRDSTEGLAAMSINAEGTLIAFATGDNNTAEENPAETNGLYTKFLIPALLSRGLNLRDAFQKAKEDVYRVSQHRQNPSIYENIVGQYALIPSISSSAPTPVRESRFDAAAEAWALIKDSQYPEDFDNFVKEFPQSDLARTASIRATQLRRATTPNSGNPTNLAPGDALNQAKKYLADGKYDQAIPLFRRAADAGNGIAAGFLGYMYSNGKVGLPKDDVQAASWWRKGADGGDYTAARNLGGMYENGLGGLPKDDVQAVSWYRKAAEAGERNGMFDLARMYAVGRGGLPKDDTLAVYWYRKAADAGDTRSMRTLGLMYERGQGGLRKDDTQAADWYSKAANGGNATAMFNLGVLYQNGRGGLPRNDTLAAQWYRKAADGGEPLGMDFLAYMYAQGRGVPQDDTEGVNWYRKAAEAGNTSSMNTLGLMYQKGRGGLPQDDVQASNWYRKAADGGNSKAMFNLASLYGNGLGISKDEKQALNWYRKAAQAGDTQAAEALKRLEAR